MRLCLGFKSVTCCAVPAVRKLGENRITAFFLVAFHQGFQLHIVCIQPFACLPNHVVGKGVIKALRKRYPGANIVAVDYDPGASEVNQLNRIKLMLSAAQKNLTGEPAEAPV